ncbi:hypothetical protein HK102_008817, partial [Quaeritorhiza haematococci]
MLLTLIEHPIVNLSLTVAVGVACTFATSIAVAYGLQYLIRDHNASQVRRQFRRRQRRMRLALRAVEEECTYVLGPQIARIRTELMQAVEEFSARAATVNSLVSAAAAAAAAALPSPNSSFDNTSSLIRSKRVSAPPAYFS